MTEVTKQDVILMLTSLSLIARNLANGHANKSSINTRDLDAIYRQLDEANSLISRLSQETKNAPLKVV